MSEVNCTVCKHEAYYSFEDNAYYCPKCNLWQEVEIEENYISTKQNGNDEEEFTIILDFQAKNDMYATFKWYMDQMKKELVEEGYVIHKYNVESREDDCDISYKPYHMELTIHSSLEKKVAFNRYMEDIFERFLETKGIILNHYSVKELELQRV